MLLVYVDADACPVKDEVYRVAGRYGWKVFVVSNASMRTPRDGDVEMVVVPGAFDAADDWIAERAEAGDVVVATDIPLAARCLQRGAVVLRPNGKRFTEDNIGDALASRELMANLREMGTIGGGPPPFDKKDRSNFLQRLDEAIQELRRKHS